MSLGVFLEIRIIIYTSVLTPDTPNVLIIFIYVINEN